MINYYKILEIPEYSDEVTIKRAYRNLSKKYHPDINNEPSSHQFFIQINQAYEVLSNPEKKQFYDSQLYHSLHHVTSTKFQDVKLNYFNASSNLFVPNSYIVVSWDVTNAPRVFIDGIGWVVNQGSFSLLVQEYGKELIIAMKAYNSQGTVFEWKLKLENMDYNPSIEAYHRLLNEGNEVEVKHFKKENQFNTYGRITKKTFIIRIVKAIIFGLFLIFSHRGKWFENDLLDIFIIIATLLYCYCQYVKRKNDLHTNYRFIVDIFFKDSDELFTIYGPKEIRKPSLKERFEKQNRYSKVALVSLALLVFSYVFLAILPKYEKLEEPTYHDSYFVREGRNSKRAVAVLYFKDFFVTYTPDSKIYENYTKHSDFYVGRSILFNKPIYVKTAHTVDKKKKEFIFYIGINDTNNSVFVYLILLMLFHLWLFFTLDKTYIRFRNVSLVVLSIIYIFSTIYMFL